MKCISIFKCNPQIEVIDKSHCSLEDVPNFQNYSRSLEELFLDGNNLRVLNDNVFKLTKLRKLTFSGNDIDSIPPDIAKLVNLVELDCGRNRIQYIPEQIKFLRGLQACDFSGNNIEYLPAGLIQLKNLTCLTLNYCPIKILPDDFGLLKNLESLEMRENELEALPDSITDLENLKKLDIGGNMIQYLPEDIGRLTKLEYLIVDGNQLETVPTKIGQLYNLQCLDLDRQELKLKYLPEEIGGLTSLTDLHLSENHLQTLPDGIRKLKNLTILKADKNFLSELNPNIGGCTALQELVLSANQITKLPSTISNLTDLRSVNMDSNFLKELTPQIGNLKRLGILSLRDNLLTHLPNEIGQMDSLKVIDFSGNRLEYLPTTITALNLKALWLSKNQAQPLPKLQIDELSHSGTKVLTCYLLPQQIEESERPEQQQSFDQGEFDESENNRQAAVSFDTAAVDDAELSNDANFVRHDTPHPRELKARHQKLFTSTEKPELRGHDNASFSLTDNPHNQLQNEREYEAQEDPAIAYQQHVGYESNGLPEVPSTMQQNNFAPIKNFINRINTFTEYQTGYDGNGNNQDSKYPQDIQYEQNGRHNPQYRDSSQNYKRHEPEVTSQNKYQYQTNKPRPEDKAQILELYVRRAKHHTSGLGLAVAGGKNTAPIKDDDEGIFVTKVTSGGAAEAAGVKVGDKILAVNENIFYEGITHEEAVHVFKKMKHFTLRVLRDPSSAPIAVRQDDSNSVQGDSVVTSSTRVVDRNSNTSTFTRTYTIPVKTENSNGAVGGAVNNLRQFLLKEPEKATKPTSATLPPGMSLLDNPVNKNIIYTTLVKDYKHDLGLVLENKNDDDDPRSTWSNIVIAAIKPNSIASRDGKLQVNDRLVTINGADVTGIDLDRIMLMLEGTERFIRIVVSRGDDDDPIGAALRDMPKRPPLGSWFSSTSNMSHRPSLIESYQRPTFSSTSSLQKQHTPLVGTKPPKPPKPSHLIAKDIDMTGSQIEENPVAKPRGPKTVTNTVNDQLPQVIDAERRAAWRRERLKSIDDEVEMARLIAEAQRQRRREE